jgi:hemolysin III
MLEERIASAREELANACTHGLGLLLSLIGAPVLVAAAVARRDPMIVASAAVFAAALVLLYTTSTCYHACTRAPTKGRFRLLDHIAIYLLIAGTFTPFSVGVLRSTWGWALLAIVWALAGVGIVFKLRCGFRHERFSLGLYVTMGWLLALAIRPMLQRMTVDGVLLIVAGGLLYTAGVFFFRGRKGWSHPVWHLFVLAGSACHYFAILWHALPPLPTAQ